MSRLLFFMVLLSVAISSIIDMFEENGLQYEKIGKAKLIEASKACTPQNVSLTSYVDKLTMHEEAEESDQVMLKAHLQEVFDETCHAFNLTDENSMPENVLAIINARPSKYLNGLRLEWNSKKFQNDLMSLFLYNKINAPFYHTFEKELFNDELDIEEFAETTVFLPKRCYATDMIIEAQHCSVTEKTPLEGEVYAIAHTGQLIEKSNAFVLYDVPAHVLVNEEDVVPVKFDSCKAVNATYVLCMEKDMTHCDITKLNSCNVYAIPIGSNFLYTRSYGSGVIIATNMPEVEIDGAAVKAVSPVFTYHTSQYVENNEYDQALIMQSSRTSPATLKNPFPELTRDAENAVRSSKEPMRLYRISRKGVSMLSNKAVKSSVWDDVRDFFAHLV